MDAKYRVKVRIEIVPEDPGAPAPSVGGGLDAILLAMFRMATAEIHPDMPFDATQGGYTAVATYRAHKNFQVPGPGGFPPAAIVCEHEADLTLEGPDGRRPGRSDLSGLYPG